MTPLFPTQLTKLKRQSGTQKEKTSQNFWGVLSAQHDAPSRKY
jgi:hypothetical protein